MVSKRQLLVLVVSIATILTSSNALAATFFADFQAGIDANVWEVDSNQPLYTVDTSQGDIRFRGELHGDFDVSVDFRDAFVELVNGQPGNQVQLNVVFGGLEFDVVHSDEIKVGRNNHVWIDPPGFWWGEQATAATSGTLRILRQGLVIAGYFNDTLIYNGIEPDSPPITFLSFSLQNNGTTDSTSVTFDNFRLTADSIVPETASGTGDAGNVPSPATVHVRPNPFAQTTSIEFTLATAGEVRASIYDAAGRPIADLADGYHSEGTYAVNWDGHNQSGIRVPSGVYFLGFHFEGTRLTRKVVLIR